MARPWNPSSSAPPPHRKPARSSSEPPPKSRSLPPPRSPGSWITPPASILPPHRRQLDPNRLATDQDQAINPGTSRDAMRRHLQKHPQLLQTLRPRHLRRIHGQKRIKRNEFLQRLDGLVVGKLPKLPQMLRPRQSRRSRGQPSVPLNEML